jgi:hypothetical protein
MEQKSGVDILFLVSKHCCVAVPINSYRSYFLLLWCFAYPVTVNILTGTILLENLATAQVDGLLTDLAF